MQKKSEIIIDLGSKIKKCATDFIKELEEFEIKENHLLHRGGNMFKLYKNEKLLLVAPYWEDLVSFVEILKKYNKSLLIGKSLLLNVMMSSFIIGKKISRKGYLKL